MHIILDLYATLKVVKVGYARVSSIGQNLDSQLVALKEYGCEKIFQEKVSGTSTQGREKLRECLDFVRESDEVVFTRTDRLARSILDLQLIVKDLIRKISPPYLHLESLKSYFLVRTVRCRQYASP